MAITPKTKSFGQKLVALFRNRDFMISVFVTAVLVILFRIISVIPLPGITVNQQNANQNQNDFFTLFNLLGGGGLSQLSLFAVGISPYISSQIIMQLLSTDLVPPLAKLAKSGEVGRRKIEVITRIVTFPFAIVQAFAIIAIATNGQTSVITAPNDPASQSFYILTMTAGSYLAIFIGDMISKKGVGNGITLLILSGILAQLPNGFIAIFNILSGLAITINPLLTSIINFSVYFLAFIILLLATTYINLSVRKIPIQQTGQGMVDDLNALPYLPIKVNAAGVIPVIFASSIMSIPITIAQFQPQSESRWFVEDFLSLTTPVGVTLFAVFVILFTFFYSYIQINPEQLSKNFEKGHRFIPGIRPGYDTEKHISKVLLRTNFIGAPFLAIISVIPYVVSIVFRIPNSLALGGTGIIIMVSASLEFFNALKSAATTTNYQQLRSQMIASVTALAPAPVAIHDAKTNAKLLPAVNATEDDVSQLW